MFSHQATYTWRNKLDLALNSMYPVIMSTSHVCLPLYYKLFYKYLYLGVAQSKKNKNQLNNITNKTSFLKCCFLEDAVNLLLMQQLTSSISIVSNIASEIIKAKNLTWKNQPSLLAYGRTLGKGNSDICWNRCSVYLRKKKLSKPLILGRQHQSLGCSSEMQLYPDC